MFVEVKAVLQYGFKNWKLELISVYHSPLSIQYKRVVEKAGFKFESVLRDAFTNYWNSIRWLLLFNEKSDYFDN